MQTFYLKISTNKICFSAILSYLDYYVGYFHKSVSYHINGTWYMIRKSNKLKPRKPNRNLSSQSKTLPVHVTIQKGKNINLDTLSEASWTEAKQHE